MFVGSMVFAMFSATTGSNVFQEVNDRPLIRKISRWRLPLRAFAQQPCVGIFVRAIDQ
jgi:hypothetical protein